MDGYLENLPPCTLTGDAGLSTAGDKLQYTVTPGPTRTRTASS